MANRSQSGSGANGELSRCCDAVSQLDFPKLPVALFLTLLLLQVAGSDTVIPLTSNSVTEEAAWCYTYAQVSTPE